MLPIQLHIIYKGKNHCKGLIEPDECSLLQLKNEVVKITSEDGLTTPESVQLLVTSPRNNVEVIVDTDAMLRIMFTAHDSLQVPIFKVSVLPTLRPDLELGGVIQSLLHALGVQLSAEQVAWVNESGNEPLSRPGGIHGPQTNLAENVGCETDANEDESPSKSEGRDVRNENVQQNVDDNDDDDWLSDFEKEFAADGSRINHQNIAEDAGVMDDGGASSDDESIDADPQFLANTSDSDFDLGTTQLKDYIEVHMYKPRHDGKHRLRLGDVFDDVDHFRKVLGEVMVDKSFEITKVYNDRRRFYGKCKTDGCPWYVVGGKIRGKGGFVIKELQNKHDCRQTEMSVNVTSKWIAEKIKSKVAVDPHTFGVRIGNLKLYRARERARTDIHGDHARGYEDLFQYAAVILKYDPGAICKVLCDTVTRLEKVLFQRFFMAFPAQRNALHNGCRPYIGLDGCHLKSKYGGVLLAAVSMDANNGMVPLAIAVCEIENTETWTWFLEILHSYFDNGSDQITFCSDRQKGLLGAIRNTWPTAFHRPCARHIYSNFSKDHPGVTLRNLFWRAVSSTNKFDHAAAMEKLKNEKLEAWQWLERELVGFTWSRYEYDNNCKVDRTSNNTSECFNSWILPHREKPCLTMLEEIRCMFMTLFTKRRKEAQSWSNIPPRVKKELDDAYETGSKMTAMASGDLHFQVKDKSYYPARRFIVDLVSRSCDCGHWELSGLPCAHAMAAISHARHTTEEYLPKYFTKQAYLNTYSVMFKPIPDKVTWEPCDRPKLSPPEITKKIGRPKKSRKRAATEPVKKNRSFYVCCSFCGGMNHNVRKCTLRPLIARQIRAQNQGLSGPGESSNTGTTSKRRKRMVMSSPDERFTHSRGRRGNRGRGSSVRGGNRGQGSRVRGGDRGRGMPSRGRGRGSRARRGNVVFFDIVIIF
ncbi:SWIM-type domain-containing protein [Citrus sinensis]|nr:SWIM-type domain-containing protein [Citrus sinensis]